MGIDTIMLPIVEKEVVVPGGCVASGHSGSK